MRILPDSETNDSVHHVSGWRVDHQIGFGERQFAEDTLRDAELATIAILAELKTMIEQTVGQGSAIDKDDTIIFAVPAKTHHYRHALMTLAKRAGWPVSGEDFRAFPEPCAILLSTVGKHSDAGTYLLVDVEGGTTDWALVEVGADDHGVPHFELRDSFRQEVGGSDVDRALADQCSPSGSRDLNASELHFLELTKITLSKQGPDAKSMVTLGGKRLVVTWADVAKSVTSVFRDRVIRAGYERFHRGDLNRLIVAGGASQSPGLLDLVAHQFGHTVSITRPEHVASACSRGLLFALQSQVLSGLEDSLGLVEYPSQRHQTWIEAFDDLPRDASRHTKHFRFDQGSGRIPLFFGQDTEWRPAGYLEISCPQASITPVWRHNRLEFIASDGSRLPWIHEQFAYLWVNAAVSFTDNTVENQSSEGTGVIIALNDGAYPDWVGNTAQLKVTIQPDGGSQVKVKTETGHWALLDVGTRAVIRPTDLPRLKSTSLPDWSFRPFSEIDSQAAVESEAQALRPDGIDSQVEVPTFQFLPVSHSRTDEGHDLDDHSALNSAATRSGHTFQTMQPLKFPVVQKIRQLEESIAEIHELLYRYPDL